MTKQFWHRGEMGDILYSLSAIKAQGGGTLMVNAFNNHNIDQYSVLRPLVERQSYITEFRGVGGAPQVEINAGTVADLRVQLDHGTTSKSPCIIRPYFEAANLPFPEYTPWLGGVTPHHERDGVEYCVINVTDRFRSPGHSWGPYLPAGRMLFLGLAHEASAFDQHLIDTGYHGVIPRIKWVATPDLLAAANIIAGAKAFFGNASSCFVLAQGVGQPNIYVEVNDNTKNACLFGHEHVLNEAHV